MCVRMDDLTYKLTGDGASPASSPVDHPPTEPSGTLFPHDGDLLCLSACLFECVCECLTLPVHVHVCALNRAAVLQYHTCKHRLPPWFIDLTFYLTVAPWMRKRSRGADVSPASVYSFVGLFWRVNKRGKTSIPTLAIFISVSYVIKSYTHTHYKYSLMII